MLLRQSMVLCFYLHKIYLSFFSNHDFIFMSSKINNACVRMSCSLLKIQNPRKGHGEGGRGDPRHPYM